LDGGAGEVGRLRKRVAEVAMAVMNAKVLEDNVAAYASRGASTPRRSSLSVRASSFGRRCAACVSLTPPVPLAALDPAPFRRPRRELLRGDRGPLARLGRGGRVSQRRGRGSTGREGRSAAHFVWSVVKQIGVC